jgi:hypothetical protein
MSALPAEAEPPGSGFINWAMDMVNDVMHFQNYAVRTPEELVKDLNALHDLRRADKKRCDIEIAGVQKKLRWEQIKSRILAALVTTALASSLTALIKAAAVAARIMK